MYLEAVFMLNLSEHLTLQVNFVSNKLFAYNWKGKPLIIKLEVHQSESGKVASVILRMAMSSFPLIQLSF